MLHLEQYVKVFLATSITDICKKLDHLTGCFFGVVFDRFWASSMALNCPGILNIVDVDFEQKGVKLKSTKAKRFAVTSSLGTPLRIFHEDLIKSKKYPGWQTVL